MNRLQIKGFYVIAVSIFLTQAEQVLGYASCNELCELTQMDTVLTRLFSNENEFDFYIGEELQALEASKDFTQLQNPERDSLYHLLNKNKQISIDKSDLWKFLGFILDTPDLQQIISQSVDILPKEKIKTIDFVVKKGDQVFFNYTPVVTRGSAVQIEILLNKVKIEKSLSHRKGKKIEFDFIAPQEGEVEIVVKNFGLFRHEGLLDIKIRADKERILLQQILQPSTQTEVINSLVLDTLFVDVLVEEIKLSHRLNIVESAMFDKSVIFDRGEELLGFSIFFFPTDQKDKLRFERKVIKREDPQEDFSIKELSRRSFTYLPEFTFPEIDIVMVNQQKQKFWKNGQMMNSGLGWEQSQNSKSNYAMFWPSDNVVQKMISLRISNKSTLYDFSLSIRVLALFQQRFSVQQEVDVKYTVEKILLSLI